MRKLSLLAPLIAAVVTTSCGNQTAQLSFVSIDPPQPKIGDVVTITFKVLDYRGEALAGQDVNFRLDSDKPGVKLEPTSTQSLKGSGLAETQIVVTGTASAVIVVADSGDKEVRSPPISFAGTTASARGLTFQCGERAGMGSGGIHAIGGYDQSRSLIAGVKLSCHAHVADRNGDGIPGAIVSFLTEAGTIGGSGTSVADVIGNADILFKTSLPEPIDLDPGTFVWISGVTDMNNTGDQLAPLWMEPYRWTTNPIGTHDNNLPPVPDPLSASFQEPRRKDPLRKKMDGTPFTNNSRDHLVTMIAFTSGEEDYFDANNNGKFDDGEPYVDLTEPFVDSNDNGTWDEGELYVDLNGDGAWSPKNGMWDANTIIWTEEKILWTGIPDAKDYQTPEPTVRPVQTLGGGPIVIGCPQKNVMPSIPSGVITDVLVADPWWNQMAQDDPSDGCIMPSNTIVNGGQASYGIPFTYPAIGEYFIEITDALQRIPMPFTTPPTPACYGPLDPMYPTPPIEWTFPINCTFTGAQLDGYKVVINFYVNGESFSNIPAM